MTAPYLNDFSAESQERIKEKCFIRIKIPSIAEDDLEEGYRFYESQADGPGTYFLDTLYSDIDSLAHFAWIHRVQ